MGAFAPQVKNGYDAVRHDPFLFVGERPCIDRRGNGTAEAHDHRDERAAGEPEFAERPVQNERHARHVARIFQNGNEEEQDEDLRDEGQNARKARPDTVVDETLRPCRGAHVFQAGGDEPPIWSVIKPIRLNTIAPGVDMPSAV